jgi:hypothetical protein
MKKFMKNTLKKLNILNIKKSLKIKKIIIENYKSFF